MTLIQMEYFVAVCKWESFVKAAQQLNVSQSTVSIAIKNIEKEHQVSLFHRNNNSLRLTDEGKLILDEVKIILKHYQKLEKTIEQIHTGTEHIAVGVSMIIGNSVFPIILSRLNETYPEVRITVDNGILSPFELLDKGLLDFVISHQHEEEYIKQRFAMLPIVQERNVLCMNTKNPLSGRESITWEDIAGEPLVLLTDSFNHTLRIKEYFRKRGLKPRILQQTDQLYVVQRYIENNIALGFLPSSTVANNPNIRYFCMEELELKYICCYWKKGNKKTSVEKFLNVVKQIGKEQLQK